MKEFIGWVNDLPILPILRIDWPDGFLAAYPGMGTILDLLTNFIILALIGIVVVVTINRKRLMQRARKDFTDLFWITANDIVMMAIDLNETALGPVYRLICGKMEGSQEPLAHWPIARFSTLVKDLERLKADIGKQRSAKNPPTIKDADPIMRSLDSLVDTLTDTFIWLKGSQIPLLSPILKHIDHGKFHCQRLSVHAKELMSHIIREDPNCPLDEYGTLRRLALATGKIDDTNLKVWKSNIDFVRYGEIGKKIDRDNINRQDDLQPLDPSRQSSDDQNDEMIIDLTEVYQSPPKEGSVIVCTD